MPILDQMTTANIPRPSTQCIQNYANLLSEREIGCPFGSISGDGFSFGIIVESEMIVKDRLDLDPIN